MVSLNKIEKLNDLTLKEESKKEMNLILKDLKEGNIVEL